MRLGAQLPFLGPRAEDNTLPLPWAVRISLPERLFSLPPVKVG
jgi:hypothetical protein